MLIQYVVLLSSVFTLLINLLPDVFTSKEVKAGHSYVFKNPFRSMAAVAIKRWAAVSGRIAVIDETMENKKIIFRDDLGQTRRYGGEGHAPSRQMARGQLLYANWLLTPELILGILLAV